LFNEYRFPYCEWNSSATLQITFPLFQHTYLLITPTSHNPFPHVLLLQLSNHLSLLLSHQNIPKVAILYLSVPLMKVPHLTSQSPSHTSPSSSSSPPTVQPNSPRKKVPAYKRPPLPSGHPMNTRAKTGITCPILHHILLLTHAKPKTTKQALSNPTWLAAMQVEFDALQDINTWTLVPLPSGRVPIGCKWVFRVKENPNGTVNK